MITLASRGDAFLLCLEVARRVLVGHLAGEEARRDRVDPDALATRPLLGEVAGQAVEAGLARGVGRLGEPGSGEAQDRADVDDRTALPHHPSAGLRSEEHTS